MKFYTGPEDLKDVIPAVVNEFNAALAEAQNILADENATQEQINASFDRLAHAMHMLDFEKGDKTALKASNIIKKIKR
jgi:hypothetical protein